MNASTKLIPGLALLTLIVLPACTTSPSGTAIDRLKQPAAAHALALTGEDTAKMRETGLSLLAQLEAVAGW